MEKLKSDSTCAKMSQKASGRKMSKRRKPKISATKAANWTPERRAKMGAHLKGKSSLPKTIAKRRPHCLEETRRKIGETNRANYASPEIREQMRQRNLAQENISPIFRASTCEIMAKASPIPTNAPPPETTIQQPPAQLPKILASPNTQVEDVDAPETGTRRLLPGPA